MQPLSPRYVTVLRIRLLIPAIVLVAAALAADLLFLRPAGLPTGIAAGPALLAAAAVLLLAPPRHYRRWAYEVTEDELHIDSGLWVRRRTFVPFGRVQHIDVARGPVERRCGVATLTLHTAGTRHSAVSLPGLEHRDAETLRDLIRTQIRQDLA